MTALSTEICLRSEIRVSDISEIVDQKVLFYEYIMKYLIKIKMDSYALISCEFSP